MAVLVGWGNMKIALSKSEYMDDWYTIVRAQHIEREWMERTTQNSYRFMSSERLSPEACIEGTAEHMIALARAIQLRGAFRGGRRAFPQPEEQRA